MSTDEILAELRDLLDTGNLVTLRHSLGETYAPNVPLQHYKGRIYLFPFGRQPKKDPIVYLNGIMQAEGPDYQLHVLGEPRRTLMVALAWTFDLREGDMTTARYFVE